MDDAAARPFKRAAVRDAARDARQEGAGRAKDEEGVRKVTYHLE